MSETLENKTSKKEGVSQIKYCKEVSLVWPLRNQLHYYQRGFCWCGKLKPEHSKLRNDWAIRKLAGSVDCKFKKLIQEGRAVMPVESP